LDLNSIERGSSGRVTKLEIQTDKGNKSILLVKEDIRRVLNFIPSNLFPIYKLNRYIHYLRGNRTKSTLKRMPDRKLLEDYKRKFGITKINYSGTLIWIIYPLSKIIGYKKSKKLSDFCDKNLPKWMSFKFIMEAKKISE